MLEKVKNRKKEIKETKRKKTPAMKKIVTHGRHDHPDYTSHIKRLNRVKGQIEGIERMILDRRYCPDIIAQLRAASAALKAVESEIFKSHLKGCVKSAFLRRDAFEAEEKIHEIIQLIY